MTARTTARARLRAVISDYHRADEVDGEHFEAAAAALAPALHAGSTASLIAAIDTVIDGCRYPDVAELLHNARRRTCGDIVGLARANNDAINARITGPHRLREAT